MKNYSQWAGVHASLTSRERFSSSQRAPTLASRSVSDSRPSQGRNLLERKIVMIGLEIWRYQIYLVDSLELIRLYLLCYLYSWPL